MKESSRDFERFREAKDSLIGIYSAKLAVACEENESLVKEQQGVEARLLDLEQQLQKLKLGMQKIKTSQQPAHDRNATWQNNISGLL